MSLISNVHDHQIRQPPKISPSSTSNSNFSCRNYDRNTRHRNGRSNLPNRSQWSLKKTTRNSHKAHPLHLRPGPPPLLRHKSPPTATFKFRPPIRRPRLRTVITKPTPLHVPHQEHPRRRAHLSPSTDHTRTARKATAKGERAYEVGEVCFQEGD